MMSKKSYFSPTIFWKDIRICWPLWSLYLLGLFVLIPARLLIHLMNNQMVEESRSSLDLESLREVINPNYIIGIIFVMALVLGIVLFQYLNTSRAAIMLHSLPLSRPQILFTKIVAGFVMLSVPQLLMFLVSTLICISYHVPAIMVLLQWYLTAIANSFIFLSMVTLCAQFAGHGVAITFYYVLLNAIYPIAHSIFELFISFFGFGLSSFSIDSEMGRWTFFCPAWQLIQDVDVRSVYRGGLITNLSIVGWKTILSYMAFAVFLFAVSMLLYRRRKLELAGDLVAIPVVRPVVRWLVGWIVGALMAYVLYYFVALAGKKLGTYGLLVAMLIFGFVGFMASQMIIKKSFRVFRKKFWFETALFFVFCSSFFFGSIGIARYSENYVPNYDNLEYACITFSYPMYFYGDDIAFVEDIQHELTANKDLIDGSRLPTAEKYLNISIVYKEKNGNLLERKYSIASNETSDLIGAKIENVEWKNENFEMGYFPEMVSDSNSYFSVALDILDLYSGAYYSTTELLQYDRIFCAEMKEAVTKDAMNYSLQKYNIPTSYTSEHSYDYANRYVTTLDISYKTNLAVAPEIGEKYYDKCWNYDTGDFYFLTCLKFGPDCRNIIDCLLKYNVIYSEDELVTISQYNDYYEFYDNYDEDVYESYD